eukprot:XP_025008223.1 uncharacterized protein LOC112532789 isoform X2 [Gallus gallus]
MGFSPSKRMVFDWIQTPCILQYMPMYTYRIYPFHYTPNIHGILPVIVPWKTSEKLCIHSEVISMYRESLQRGKATEKLLGLMDGQHIKKRR